MAAAAIAVPAIASVVGGYLKKRGQDRATDAQTAATDKAFAHEEKQDARSEAWYASAWADWNQKREMLMKRYNLDITPPGGMPEGPGGPPGATPRGPGGMSPAVMQAKGIEPGQNLGELGGWNDWKRQGLASPQGGGTA